MTVPTLQEETTILKEAISKLLTSFEQRTGCRIVAVRVREDESESSDEEVEVRLDPLLCFQRLPN